MPARVLELEEIDTATALFAREALVATDHLEKMEALHEAQVAGEETDKSRVAPVDLDMLRARIARLEALTADFQMARNGDGHVRVVPRGEEVTLTSGVGKVVIVLPSDSQAIAKAMLALGKAGFTDV